MAHLNINGLLSKLDFIKIMKSESKFEIFAISESKLDASIHDNDYFLYGYYFYRLDRNRHGGGVLFYINEQLESHPLKHLSDSNYESLWIKVYLSKTKPIFLSVVYRPPSNGSDLDSTENLCSYLKQCENNFLEVMRFSFVEI